ncbi:MAG: Glu-tRNAGln amidotransferase subunit [Gemmatimonadota bacterium]|jgi:aspartyl-tRNA(Asn)/glutamyl-tRNA(Gln) amidotransferase subunit C
MTGDPVASGVVSVAEVRRVAALARVAVNQEALPALAADLGGILAHMEQLRAFAEDDGPSASAPPGMPWRADCPRDAAVAPSSASVTLSAIAPRQQDGFFLVPQVVAHAAGHEPVAEDA